MIDGQLSLFDLIKDELEESVEITEPLLVPGQHVFVVKKGDIFEYSFTGEMWLCGDTKMRGYRLAHASGEYWNVTTDNEIGNSTFLDRSKAENIAEEYLRTHEVIRKEKIHPSEVTAFSYIRECDGRKMTAFYCELENGMLYAKEFMTYAYMMLAEKREKAIKRFMQQREFEYCKPEQIDYEPKFKNMYSTKGKCGWDYTEAMCSYAVG